MPEKLKDPIAPEAEKPEDISKLQNTIQWLLRVINDLKQRIMQKQPQSNQERLYTAAVESLGKEMSPQDLADDNVACVESVCNVLRKVIPDFPIILGTATLLAHLKQDRRFKPTLDPLPGNVILSATGTGNGTIRGHVGIHLGNGRIASNSSKNGLWEDNFSIEEWVKRYRTQGGMPIYYFEIV